MLYNLILVHTPTHSLLRSGKLDGQVAMSEVSSLLKYYGLSEEKCNKVVSDRHLEKISLSHCGRWRALPSYLGLPSLLVEDIDRSPLKLEEGERRQKFFHEWKQRRGFNATYKSLIVALLETNCRGDAESVCQLLKVSAPPHIEQPTSDSIPTLYVHCENLMLNPSNTRQNKPVCGDDFEVLSLSN